MSNKPTNTNHDHQAATVSLVVPRALVKTVKSALEEHGQLSKDRKIYYANPENGQTDGGSFIIPTRLALLPSVSSYDPIQDIMAWKGLLQEGGLVEHASDIEVVWVSGKAHEQAFKGSRSTAGSSTLVETVHGVKAKNPLSCVLDEWISTLSEDILHSLQINTLDQKSISPRNAAYMVYPPLLLLPSDLFSGWLSKFSCAVLSEDVERLHQSLCAAFRVTHIAVNGIIPSFTHHRIPAIAVLEQTDTIPNILRSPTNLTPLYGDFGPLLPVSSRPSAFDFNRAFWCTARQNGILQTWAPRYSMFSRGNISEKARILKLDTLTQEGLGCLPKETSAVDLYAGIGYFAFSYAKAGVGKVFCWEINPWSIEGLRRGAEGNGWSASNVARDVDSAMSPLGQSKIVIFEEGNEHALKTLAKIRDSIPAVRHVNCGFLPSSRNSWKTAVQLLDIKKGGWIHAHENIAKKDIETRKVEIVQIFFDLVNRVHGSALEARREVACNHVERVKSYAPGVIHCVLDICIRPLNLSP